MRSSFGSRASSGGWCRRYNGEAILRGERHVNHRRRRPNTGDVFFKHASDSTGESSVNVRFQLSWAGFGRPTVIGAAVNVLFSGGSRVGSQARISAGHALDRCSERGLHRDGTCRAGRRGGGCRRGVLDDAGATTPPPLLIRDGFCTGVGDDKPAAVRSQVCCRVQVTLRHCCVGPLRWTLMPPPVCSLSVVCQRRDGADCLVAPSAVDEIVGTTGEFATFRSHSGRTGIFTE